MLRQHLPALPRPAWHFDLRFFAAALGLRGGLKKLEEALGFGRPDHLHGVNGLDAIRLWARFGAEGDRQALRRLAEYNFYDSVQLRTLAGTLYNRAVEALAGEVSGPGFVEAIARCDVFQRGEALRDMSRLLDAL